MTSSGLYRRISLCFGDPECEIHTKSQRNVLVEYRHHHGSLALAYVPGRGPLASKKCKRSTLLANGASPCFVNGSKALFSNYDVVNAATMEAIVQPCYLLTSLRTTQVEHSASSTLLSRQTLGLLLRSCLTFSAACDRPILFQELIQIYCSDYDMYTPLNVWCCSFTAM
jgi:hypothetical protein